VRERYICIYTEREREREREREGSECGLLFHHVETVERCVRHETNSDALKAS